MTTKRVNISSIIETQFPLFVREEYPLITQFVSEYYKSLDNQGLTYDILQNIDQYVKLDHITNLIEFTNLSSNLDLISSEVSVVSTVGFPENNGLIKINNEIIYYKSKNSTTFLDCVRGFSGVTSFNSSNTSDQLVFSESSAQEHDENATVQNLSILFLKEFFIKIKKQLIPGFENRTFYGDETKRINEKNFIIHSKDFYSSKGTDNSFKILFKAIYGDPATVIKPRDFLIKPSDANYKVTKDIVVEPISGDPIELRNRTLFQKQSQGLTETFATVTEVEEIIREDKKYYIISLDYDYDKDVSVRGSIFGDFSIHAKTKSLDYVQAGSTSITVDSTLGFPSTGELLVKSSNGNNLLLTYESKNNSQFLGCNITENINIGEDICLNVYAYSIVNEQEVRVRILGVINDINIPIDNKYYEKADIISFNTLGKKYQDFKYNDWIVDVPNKHLVSNFSKFGLNQILIHTYDATTINLLDEVYIQFFDSTSQSLKEEIFSVVQISQDRKSFYVTSDYEIEKIYYIRKRIKLYNDIISNVQNVYGDNKNDVYVTAQSIPDYIDSNIEKRNFSIEIFGLLQPTGKSKVGINTILNDLSQPIELNQIHNYINGDSVIYVQTPETYTLTNGKTINLNIYGGLEKNKPYYVKKISNTEIKLFNSRSDIYFSKYNLISYNRLYSPINLKEVLYSESDKINLLSNNYFLQSNGFVILFDDSNNTEVWYYSYEDNQWEKINADINGFLYPQDFLSESNTIKELKDIDLIKKISSPQTPIELEETIPGTTGILVNGVEILNYKSNDFVYYGNLEKIDIVSGGEEYDVINVPSVEATNGISTATSAKVHLEVTGKLEKIEVLDGGFDFIEEPKIKISGGNGIGAEAKCNLIPFVHEVEFVPSVSFVDLGNNVISFSTYHKFRNYEEIIYQTNGNSPIGGLSTSSTYVVTINDDYSIKLHKTEKDALSGIAITFSSYGTGTQKIVAKQQKLKIGSISIINSGSNYRNNYVSISESGINTYRNVIVATNHGYVTGDIVEYSCIGINPTGFTTSKYYVNALNENEFRLCPVGVGSTTKDVYFKTDQFFDFVDSGIGTHIFKHEQITVEVDGLTGISSYSKQLFEPNVRPIFRGTITNAYLQNGGIGYGASEILNYEKQPTFNLKIGKGAQLKANILNGTIKEVYVINPGEDYYSVPDLIISGSGVGCILSAEIEDGKIKKIIIINGGYGYEQKNTTIEVRSYGKNAVFNAKIKSWQINYVSRILNSNTLTSPDDGILYFGEYNKIKYCHAYCPNKLRQKTYSKFLDSQNNVVVRSDYENSTSTIKYHSPIIGWAYDGNPIYGPYGYSNPNVIGNVRKMISGYIKNPKSILSRPPEKIDGSVVFPIGSFVDDYIYTDNGDLDEYNGRYCITPEYPNGVYAYFATISVDDDFTAEFPYFIGKCYKSTPIIENFNSKLSQNSFDYESTNLLRNTSLYSIDSEYSNYEFLNNPGKETNQNSRITSIRYSSLDSIGIVTSGENYSVGDPIKFNNIGTNGSDASAIVDQIKGKDVVSIKNNNYSISNVELSKLKNSNYIIGIATTPHTLKDFDLISITGNYNSVTKNKIDIYTQVGISSNSLILASGITSASQTGVITEFSVIGDLSYPSIMENDFYQIEEENIKILQIDKNSSKIKVLRQSTGLAHTANTKLFELTRKLYFDDSNYNISEIRNKELYFDPNNSVGFGTTSGSTVQVNYTGIGTTSLYVPPGNIYIPNHELETNTNLNYLTNGGSSIQVSNGLTTFDLTAIQSLYSIKINDHFIGISSTKVAIGTQSNYVSVGTTDKALLYFVGYGTSENHSFRTNYSSQKAKIQKNTTTVSTASTHGLKINDLVNISVISGISTTIKIQYNDKNRRIISKEKSFSGIDTSTSIFTIPNHNYYSGQPLIYESSSPSPELENESIYYVNLIDSDRFKISRSYYDAFVANKTIEISSTSSGKFKEINPNFSIIIGQKVIFDLSDSSLSFSDGFNDIPAFTFDLYYDKNYNKKYYYNNSGKLEVFKTGEIGVSNQSKLELNVSEDTPKLLYYKLTPIFDTTLPESKQQIYTDELVYQNNTISVYGSDYSGSHIISGIGSTTFDYQLSYLPEVEEYNDQNSNIEYYTNSKSALGGIQSIKLISGGRYYNKLPGITSITSQNGKNAVVFPESKSIGKIKSTYINDIGYDYSIDKTVRPTITLPAILRIEPFSSIESITCTFIGKNYNYSPDLIVIDSVTNSIINDIILDFNHITGKVSIIKNSSGFNNAEPKIITINNSNAIGIHSLAYNQSTKIVTAYLQEEYTDINEFPISTQDKIFIENTTILETDSNYIGYNSSEYNYQYFPVIGITTSISGDRAIVQYDMSDYVQENKQIGTFDFSKSKGSIVSENDVPKFKTIIKTNSYFVGEEVTSDQVFGIVNSWDQKTNYAKIQTTSEIKINTLLVGKTSGSIGKVVEVINSESDYNIDYYNIRNKGWDDISGFLNTNSQRLHDNDYYQYFSYSVKSRVPLENWSELVDTSVHTVGFKKFSDLSIESRPDQFSGISSTQNQGTFVGISDLNTIIDLESTYDFDLGLETNVFELNGTLFSDEITFNSAILQDYSQSIGNRVLIIDDISDEFNTNKKATFVTAINI